MSDSMLYTFPSPLEGYRGLPPLSNELEEDGKSFKNPKSEKLSESYERFTSGVDNGRRGGMLFFPCLRVARLITASGFDVHIYYHSGSEEQTRYAKELWERIRREFPELR
jgi:hypothetical protein